MSKVLRGLSFCAPVFLLDAPASLAQTVQSAAFAVDIPAQPLPRALAVFASQTGLQIVYVSGILANKRSHTTSAGLSANETLTRLLKGTGLKFQYLTPDTVRIVAGVAPETRSQNVLESEPYQVIVTANRREESLQDVPITVQAITADYLEELSVTTFNDLLKYTTNITYSGNGPGAGNIFIRGLGSVGTGNQNQSTIAPFPNVALYLDDQAVQFPARNNDVYMVDLDRVEVLEGPQGTLFGGGAEAGAIRYITNKPKLDVTAREFTAGYGVTANGGDPNTLVNGVINIPLITDALAVRAVIFSERRGGYIDNVPSTIGFVPGTPEAATGVRASNASLVSSNTNPVSYGGFRLSGLYQIQDDWSLLIEQNYQDMNADGYFYAYPSDSNGKALQPYEITAFTPAYTHDRYESTAWTLNGKLGGLQGVYSGSYMVRHIEGQQDYSNYLRSATGSYYACIGSGAGYFNPAYFSVLAGKPLQCYPPVAAWHDSVQNEHQSHEVRVSSPEEQRVRALVGAFWEKFVINDQMNWNYLAIPQCNPANLGIALAGGADCLSAVGPLPGTQVSDPSLRENTNNAFGEDMQRGYKQYAFFASVDFDIIPKMVTVTAGTRRYHYDEFEEGSVWYSGIDNQLIVDHPNGACTAAGGCGYPIGLAKSESGFRSRASLTWHLTPDVMTYYTFSQGFRPGGFNRAGPAAIMARLPYCGQMSNSKCPDGPRGTGQYIPPAGFQSDNLINNEVGLKSELLDHRALV
ncbi:MAG: TonB-dependent receptor plug domain-containing protein, partial [Terriglobales bacterium]